MIAATLERATARFLQDDFPTALTLVDQVLSLDPSHVETRILHATILTRMGEVDDAAAILTALRGDLPGDSRVTRRLAFVRKQQGRWDESVALFDSLPPAERTPSQDEAIVYAEVLANSMQLRRAADALASILIPDPWYGRAYLLLTQIDDRKGRAETAAMWSDLYRSGQPLRDAQQISLNHERRGATVVGLQTLSAAMYEAGHLHGALTLARRAIDTAPRRPDAYFTLCRVYCELGRTADARELLAEMPDTGRLHAALGDTHAADEEFAAAIAEYERALGLEPDEEAWQRALDDARARHQAPPDPLAAERRTLRQRIGEKGLEVALPEYLALARLRARAGEMDRARALALFALRSAPTDAESLRVVAEVFDRPEDAFVRLCVGQRILRSDPTAIEFRAAMIEDHLLVDARLDLAQSHTRALLSQGRTADRLVLKARVDLGLGRTPAAARSLQAALDLEPGHAVAQRLLAEATAPKDED